MTTDIERLAKRAYEAMVETVIASPFSGDISSLVDWNSQEERLKENWRSSVRVVVKEMREPDEIALSRIIHPLNAGPFSQFKEQWRAMIDHILGERE